MKLFQVILMLFTLSWSGPVLSETAAPDQRTSCHQVMTKVTHSFSNSLTDWKINRLLREFHNGQLSAKDYNRKILAFNTFAAQLRQTEGHKKPQPLPWVRDSFSSPEYATPVLSLQLPLVDIDDEVQPYSEGTTLVLKDGRVFAYQFAQSQRLIHVDSARLDP